MEKIAQQDDEQPTEEPNGPIGEGESEHGERRAHNDPDHDNVEEELSGPPCAASGIAMPEDQATHHAKSEPSSHDYAGGVQVPKARKAVRGRRRREVGRIWSSRRRIIRLGG